MKRNVSIPSQVNLSPPPADRSDRPLLVGYSGGLDSSVLLHRLASDDTFRRHGLRAIHVHHGLHVQADEWARHCERECAALGIELTIVRADVARDSGDGLEAAARNARHAAFADALAEDDVLVLAHHRDDQAETFLLRALRASGVDGLGAMRAWRRFQHGWLWRPLLDTTRAQLLEYATRHGLRWIEDPSNGNDAHDRNFLRNRVLPLLRERWPGAGDAFAQSARLQQEAAALLDEGDAVALAQVRCTDPTCLDTERLAALPAARRARVLRRWVIECGLPPLPAEGVARIERDLLCMHPDDTPMFAWRDACIRRWRDLLWAERDRPALPRDFNARWDGTAPLQFATGDRLQLEQPTTDASTPWIVHARQGGERITLAGRDHSHALKDLLQDLGVPPWLRARMPLVSATDGTLLAAGDLVLSATFDAWLRTHGTRLRWVHAAP